MLDQQIAEGFIGRQREIEIFMQWLLEVDGPWILYFYDALKEWEKKGGVGKTWLLRKAAALAKEQNETLGIVTVDFFNVADRDGITIAERVFWELKETYPSWTSTSFEEFLEEYHNTYKMGNVDLVELRLRLSNALKTDLHNLDDFLHKTNKYLLVFFDTFELIEQNPSIAVLDPVQTFPDNYHFKNMGVVIAGRNAPNWNHSNWQGRQDEVRSVAISPFSQEEMIQYINTKSLWTLEMTPVQVRALYVRTEGRPILVGLVTDLLNHRILKLDQLVNFPKADFESRLVTLINDLENPINWIILFMAHAYHRFNLTLMDWILRESTLKKQVHEVQHRELLATLPTLSFVRRSGSSDDFVLHDEMRRLVILHCWNIQDPDRRVRQEISRSLVRYYEHELVIIETEQIRQSYIVEMLYHKLYVNLDDGLHYFQQHFRNAIDRWQNAFARSLLIEALRFTSRMTSEQRYDMKLAEAILLRKEENADAALDIYMVLEHEADEYWFEIHQADILFEKGNCFQQQSRLSEASDSYQRCLELVIKQDNQVRYAELLGLLGFIKRREGELDEALRYYEESIATHKNLGNQQNYADMLNNMGNVYRLQGKIEEALRRCKIGWRIRRELFQQGQGSEIAIGLSLATLGIIYLNINDLVSAESFFQEAYEIYRRADYKKGLAAIYNRFGQIDMARGNLSQAKQWFEKAYDASIGINAESQINSLNKQGWVLVLQNQYHEAIAFFKQAINLAQQINDYYQEAESLIDLADTFERLGQHESSVQVLKEAEGIAIKYHYNYLLGLAEEFQGDIKYHADEYQAAFEYFGEACHYMALYNAVQYNKVLRKVVDLLVSIPISIIPLIINSLLLYWTDLGLEKDYPELITACEEVRRLLDL